MRTVPGSGNTILQFGGSPRQISLSNLDAVNGINIKINNDPSGMNLEPSEKRGWRINKGVYQVEITAIGSWEVTVE